MSVVTEILSLRRNQFSSMTTLLSAIDRYWATQCDEHVVGRKYAVFEAADMLLINVARFQALFRSARTISHSSSRKPFTCPLRKKEGGIRPLPLAQFHSDFAGLAAHCSVELSMTKRYFTSCFSRRS